MLEHRYLALYQEHYSAFTVAELGEMLPKIVHRYTPAGKEHHSDIRYWNNGYKWCIRIGEFDDEEMPCLDFSGVTEADARVKMLIYLLENGWWTLEPSKGVYSTEKGGSYGKSYGVLPHRI